MRDEQKQKENERERKKVPKKEYIEGNGGANEQIN